MIAAALLLAVAPAAPFAALETQPPSVSDRASEAPVVRTVRSDPRASLQAKGFSDRGIALIVEAGDKHTKSLARRATVLPTIERKLKAETRREAPNAAVLAGFLSEVTAFHTAEATDSAHRMSGLLQALSPADLKLYLEHFGLREPNLLMVGLSLPTSK